MLRVLTVAAVAHTGWKSRSLAVDNPSFAVTVSLILAVTNVVSPSYALYNQVMLLPALLIIIRDRRLLLNRMSRVLLSLVAILLLWTWLASVVLAGLSFVLQPKIVEQAWALPMWTVLHLSVGVAALMLVHPYQKTFAAPVKAGSS